MKRFLATLVLDCKVQFRNRYYHVSLAMAIFMIALFRSFFNHEITGFVIPALFLAAIAGTTYMYIAGLVLFEKAEGTLESIVVSPLTVDEYLNSKLITLTTLTAFESLLIVLLSYGWYFYWLPFLLGLLMISILYILLGFIVVSRYDAITDFLMPSIVLISVLELPILYYFDLTPHPLFYLFPTLGLTLLMKAGFEPVSLFDLLYGCFYPLVWIGILYWMALQRFERFIIRREGAN